MNLSMISGEVMELSSVNSVLGKRGPYTMTTLYQLKNTIETKCSLLETNVMRKTAHSGNVVYINTKDGPILNRTISIVRIAYKSCCL